MTVDDTLVSSTPAPSPVRTRSWPGAVRWVWMLLWPWHAPKASTTDFASGGPDDLWDSEREKTREEAALAGLENADLPEIDEALNRYEGLLHAEEERNKSTETRLTSVMGLSSIVTAISSGFFSIAIEKGYAARLGPLAPLATCVFVYAVAQLLFAVWEAVKGLAVRIMTELSPSDGLRMPGEDRKLHKIRMVKDCSDVLRNHNEVITGKVESLEIAHRCVLNFLVGVCALVCILAVAALVSVPTRAAPIK